MDLRNAIKLSCDVYFYNLGRHLGVDRISEIAHSFGFGEPTGLDLAHEKPGLVPSEEWARTKRGARWYPSETISVSIGQGPVLVTPLQVARAGVDRHLLEDHAWFTAFAPIDDPKIVVVVFVEHGGHGGAAAAPIARRLLAKYFGLTLPARPGDPGFIQAASPMPRAHAAGVSP